MPQIQNPEAVDIIRTEAMLASTDGIPQSLNNQVVPVMDMTPRFHKRIKTSSLNAASSSATNTIFTSSSNKETYIVGISMSIIKNATCDAATGRVYVQVNSDGVSNILLSFSHITLVAGEQCGTIYFNEPILADKNVSIQLVTPTYTVGTFIRNITVYYYEI